MCSGLYLIWGGIHYNKITFYFLVLLTSLPILLVTAWNAAKALTHFGIWFSFIYFIGGHVFPIFWGGGILIHLFSVFISNWWTSTREQECLFGAQWGLTKPSLGCWQGVALDSLVGVSVEVAQDRQLGFPELTVRFFPFLESRRVAFVGFQRGGRRRRTAGPFSPVGFLQNRIVHTSLSCRKATLFSSC